MNEWWSPVLFVGVIILILMVERNITDKKDAHFDERQELIRGKAYRYGFFGTGISLIAGIFFTSIYGDMYMDTPFLLTVCLCIGAGIFAVYSIINDAYIGFERTIIFRIIILIVVGGVNLAAGISSIVMNAGLPNKRLSAGQINIVVGILFMLITFTLVMKMLSGRRNRDI